VIDLYTMGPGDEVFQLFGHAAACVFDQQHPRGTCYNYGVTHFEDPVDVVWQFLRGRSRFWVATTTLARMLTFYIELDRTLYVQRLPLAPDEARDLAARFAADLDPSRRYYLYKHFDDNCTTRLRDHIDAATGGRLRAGAGVAFGPTYRELASHGFSRSTMLLVGAELLLGRSSDRHPSLWDAMFLPDVLRDEVTRRYGVEAHVVNVRVAPLSYGNVRAGRWALVGFALALGALAAAGFVTGRRLARRVSLVLVGLALGLTGALLELLAAVSTLSELTRNDLLFVFLASDLALVFLGGKWLRRYLVARLSLLALVSFASLIGVIVQPVWAPVAVVAIPLLTIGAFELRALRRPAPAPAPAPAPEPDPLVESERSTG
jgi:hypothetical protein